MNIIILHKTWYIIIRLYLNIQHLTYKQKNMMIFIIDFIIYKIILFNSINSNNSNNNKTSIILNMEIMMLIMKIVILNDYIYIYIFFLAYENDF